MESRTAPGYSSLTFAAGLEAANVIALASWVAALWLDVRGPTPFEGDLAPAPPAVLTALASLAGGGLAAALLRRAIDARPRLAAVLMSGIAIGLAMGWSGVAMGRWKRSWISPERMELRTSWGWAVPCFGLPVVPERTVYSATPLTPCLEAHGLLRPASREEATWLLCAGSFLDKGAEGRGLAWETHGDPARAWRSAFDRDPARQRLVWGRALDAYREHDSGVASTWLDLGNTASDVATIESHVAGMRGQVGAPGSSGR